jgi:hypothetical protein
MARQTLMPLMTGLLGMVVGVGPLHAEGLTWLTVHDDGTLSLMDRKGPAPLVAHAAIFFSPLGPAEKLPASDPTEKLLGPAEGGLLRDANGHELRVMRHEGSPMTILQASWSNPSDTTATLPSIDVARIPIELDVPLQQLRILGTGGLMEAAEPQGSYMWLAVADPETRRGFVVGWITGERGSGSVLPQVVDGKLTLTCRLEFGRLQVPAKQIERLETLVVGRFEDVRLGLESYAEMAARINRVKLPPQPCGYCTWYHAGSSSETRIAKLAEFAGKELAPFGFSVVQIDDGWQAGEPSNGPRKNFTTHRAAGPYSHGMKATAQAIASHSMTPGLWLMPFAGTWNDPFFKDRQHWFAKNSNGTPFETSWGGSCFDMTHPEVQTFLRENVERMTHDWGYRYLKMDGLFTGSATRIMYVNDAYREDQIGETTLSNPNKTHVDALRDGLRIVRDAAGPDVFLLGCCAPQNMRSYGGAFGLVDAMRIGPDNGATVEHLLIGPRYGSRHYFLHGRVWWNDPDPVYVRTSLSMAQSELICSWAGVTGQLTITSDELERLPADRLNLIKRIMPAHGAPARPVDLLDRELPRVWVVPASANLPNQTLLGAFQWESNPVEISESFERLGLPANVEYAAFDFWSDQLLPPLRDGVRVQLAGIGTSTTISQEKSSGKIDHCCAVLAIRTLADHPQVLSTSRHVSQGRVDIVKENWEPATRTLSGTSRVVAHDPYELRLLTRSTMGPWKVVAVRLTSPEGTIEIKPSTDPELSRVKIDVARGGEVDWQIQFEK